MTRIVEIRLDPRDVDCVLCGTHLTEGVDKIQGLPMYEGEVVPDDWSGEWGGFDVCETCFRKHRPDMLAHAALAADGRTETTDA